jgi:hypothetical protein
LASALKRSSRRNGPNMGNASDRMRPHRDARRTCTSGCKRFHGS